MLASTWQAFAHPLTCYSTTAGRRPLSLPLRTAQRRNLGGLGIFDPQYALRIGQNTAHNYATMKVGSMSGLSKHDQTNLLTITEPQSKRVPVRLRHRIEKASAAKQRKAKKQAKKVMNEDLQARKVLTGSRILNGAPRSKRTQESQISSRTRTKFYMRLRRSGD